jgi:Methyltransferase FkbM domain
MAAIRRPVGYSSSSQDRKQLIIGMMLGAVFMFWILGPSAMVDDSERLRSTTKSSGDSSWHPINVFFGDRKALPHSDQEWFSQVHQDQVIVELLGEKGYFIDLAANDASDLSNTLALERHGWNGLCIEPNPIYWYGLSHRRCTVVGAMVGGNVEKVKVKFRGVYGGIVGKLDDRLANRKHEPEAPEEWRYTATLADVLARFNVPNTIDYLSLDVEGAEMLIMKEFPFDQYTIKVLTIERPGKDLKALLQSKGYIFLKDLVWWGETLWAHKSTGLSPEHPQIQKIKTERQR